ncbi:MAG: hypothetical protein HY760_09260 [Nitrospirae bacterium]|nr:hypothetical protein [Nitrospirota bacterium]
MRSPGSFGGSGGGWPPTRSPWWGGTYVTGTLGDAAAGLELLNQGAPATGYLTKRHLRPTPRLREGRLLALRRLAASAVDLSDGLLLDLSHLCTRSRTGARIDSRKLPLSPALRRAVSRLDHDPVHYALSGGEDYEILFTVRPGKVRAVEVLGKEGGTRMTRIGEIMEAREGLTVLDSKGKVQKVKPEGFDHFRG